MSSEQSIREALEKLHLPRMPLEGEDDSHVLRILVVADLDLSSASALAEYTLQQNNQVFNVSMVDLCIACGSFVRDEDLLPYLRGKQARKHKERLCNSNVTLNRPDLSAAAPYFRSKEESAALEGLMTAAISQLESIVCRVIYCPGAQDPFTSFSTDCPRRLTPNSRNIHQQWLPLAPGIGCTALLYLDSIETALMNAMVMRTKMNCDGDPDDASDEEDSPHPSWSEKWMQMHQATSADGYCHALERLIRLAPPPDHPVPFRHPACQTILVTHYVGCYQSDSASLADSPQEDTEIETNAGSGTDGAISTGSDRPWSVDGEESSSFLRSSFVRNLLCLEIASGAAANYSPGLIEQGSSQVLLPGSLRERGEFCILEVALLEDELDTDGSSTSTDDVNKSMEREDGTIGSTSPGSGHSTSKAFAWRVRKVDFHRLSRFRERI